MQDEPDKKLDDLKRRLAGGQYAVNPEAVADAILRRSRDVAILRLEMRPGRFGEPRAGSGGVGEGSASTGVQGVTSRGSKAGSGRSEGRHSSCSYPSNRVAASMKLAPGALSITRPIQLIRALGSALDTAASSVLHAPGGAHMQSS
jgi:hypothetical protein